MKKLLALVLAVLMLASLAIASVSAEDELVKLETIIDDYGNRVMFAGGKIDAAPVVDGVISEGEYSITYTEPAANGVLMEGDITSWFAHDDDWIYHAYTMKEETPQMHSLQFYGQHHKTIEKINAGKWSDRAAITYGLQADGSIKKTFTNYVGNYTWDTDLFIEIVRDEESKMTTYELKIKKSNFVEDATWLAAHLDEMTQFTYIKWLGTHGDGDHWSRVQYTAQEKLALVDMGVTANINWGFYTVDFGAKPDGYGVTTTTEAPATTTTVKAQTTTAAATTTVAATTTAKAADATTTAAPEKEGCGSTLAISALVMIPTLAGGAMLLKRRKED